jgi:hypothetical protein
VTNIKNINLKKNVFIVYLFSTTKPSNQTYQGESLDRYNELSGVSPVLGRCTRFIRGKTWTGIMNCLVKARSWVGVPDLPGGSLDRYNELSGESPVLGRCTRLFRGEAWTGIMNCYNSITATKYKGLYQSGSCQNKAKLFQQNIHVYPS